MGNMTIEQNTLINMKLSGIIRGDEEMEWIAPNKEFKFIINRYENQLWMDNDGGKYIITVDIVNMVGSKILQLKFSELDAVRILDSINVFLYDWNGGTGESMQIYLDPTNLRFESILILLERVRTQDIYPPVNEEDDFVSLPDTKFQISQYSSIHETMIPMVNLFLTDEQLEDLAFKIFFFTLIDIDIPQQCDQQLENFVQNMYIEKISLEHERFI